MFFLIVTLKKGKQLHIIPFTFFFYLGIGFAEGSWLVRKKVVEEIIWITIMQQ